MFNKNGIIFNTAFRWSGEILNKALWFVFFVLLARVLGNKDFGYFTYTFAFGSLVAIFTDLGTNIYLVKTISKEIESRRELGRVIELKILISFLVLAISSVIAFLTAEKPWIVIAFTFSLLLSAFLDPAVSVFRAHKQMYYETIIMLIWRVLIVGLSLLGIYLLHFGLIEISVAFIAGGIIALAGAIIIIKKAYDTDFFSFRKPDLKIWLKMLKISVPMGVLVIFSGIFFKFNVILLEHFKTSLDVGWYSAAFKLIEGTFFIPSIFIGTLFPFLCETNEDSRISDSSHFLFKRAFLFLLAISFAIAVIFTVFSEKLILLLYGFQYLPATNCLRIICWALVFIFSNELFLFTFLSVDKQKTVFNFMAVSLIVYIVLCLILIPVYGAIGCSWTLLLTQLILFFLNLSAIRGLK